MTDRTTYQLEPAFLLHRRPYSNRSLLVECFALHHGRFPAIAKGVMSGRGAGAALLQPFVPLKLKWSGRGEVKTITGYEQSGNLPGLQGRALYCGFYLNELLMRLLQRNDPHEELFGFYTEALTLLADDQREEQVLRRFEIQMFNALGYALVLDQDVENDRPLLPNKRYDYLLETGPVPAAEGTPGMVSGSTLLALACDQPLDKGGQREARDLSRHLLTHYLGGKPLKSRELFLSALKN
ncbi:MAG: DNA repair protein RecO [Candidatus Sedimenticola sp. (ex Thyasira tokunagai)]